MTWGGPRRHRRPGVYVEGLRRYGGQSPAIAPLPSGPDDCDERLKRLRRRLRLTQRDFARRIGAANKAVVYQWESRKRTPSPVFWKRVEALGDWS
jgi:DNA-binding XRE family transcriptional regulator